MDKETPINDEQREIPDGFYEFMQLCRPSGNISMNVHDFGIEILQNRVKEKMRNPAKWNKLSAQRCEYCQLSMQNSKYNVVLTSLRNAWSIQEPNPWC